MIVLFCLFAVVSSRSALDGPSEGYAFRILDGKNVSIEEYPYQLSLRYMKEHYCGASILTAKYAITAAHCTLDMDLELLSIQSGITSQNDENGQVIKVKKIHQHPEFNVALMDYDLAILELAEDIEFSERALPINIMQTNKSIIGEVGVVTGWGLNREDAEEMSNNLQAIEIPILDHKTCQQKYEHFAAITPRMFCAGDANDGKDSCQGDSGGPFAINGELVGVVSWGWGCGDTKYPGVYANVTAMIDFVKNVTKN